MESSIKILYGKEANWWVGGDNRRDLSQIFRRTTSQEDLDFQNMKAENFAQFLYFPGLRDVGGGTHGYIAHKYSLGLPMD